MVIDWGLAKELDAAVSDDAPADVRTPDTATDVTLAPDDHSLAGAIDHVAAGATAGSSDRVLTRPGDILGTAAYMPPEQAAGASVDRRADVYALGALLYNLLAGATPYQGSTAEILVQLRAGAPLATTPDLEGAPRDLVSIARKAMARVPADRYADAAAFVAELRRFTAGQVVGAHQYSTGEALRRWFRKHRVLAAAMIAGVAAGAIAVAAILDARDAALEERHRTEFLLARVRADEGNHLLATGHTWLAALELADAVRLGADTPGIRRSLAEAMRGIDSMIVHTPHTPRREYAGGPTQFDAIAGAAFSPDGRALVVSTYEGFDIYATADGRPLASGTRPEAWATETPRDGNRRPAGKVRYTPDGRYLVNNEAWPAIRAGVWDAATGELLVARMAPDGYHFTGTRSADGMIAELGRGNDGPAVGALDLRSDTVIAASADILTFPAPTELAPRCDPASLTGELAEAASAGRCGRSLDGRTVATLARGELALWDAATGARLQTTPLRAATTTPVFVDHDRHLFLSYPREIGGGDLQVTGRVEIRDLQTGELIDELQGNAVALSADRLRVAVQPAQRGVVVAALDREPALATFDRAAHGLDRTLAVNTKGTTIVGVVADGTLRAFDLLDGRARSLPVLREPAAMSRDGRRLIGTRADGALDVVEIATGLVVRMIAPSSHAPVQAVALDPTGDTALVLHTDAISDVWSIATGGHTQFSDTHADHHVGSENILACHRTGGRPRYDLVTKFEDEVDPTPPHCETATDDAAVAVQAPARFHHLDIRGAKVYVEEVTIDGYQLEARTPSFWTNVAVDLPAPPIRIAATRDLVASGVATWTLHGAEVGRRRQLAAPEREVWFTPDRKRLVIVDALGNVSVWDQHLETRTGDELVAALRARIGLEIVDGMILADEPEDERAHWRTATARGWSSISPAVP
ncbi:MAG: hypothetical protein K8W52_16355 [Deltaproteobacteria bacterium]|nr:hypothetical protein [Deltaproteobacteria bacterium]